MKKVLLVSESLVYLDLNGELIAHGGGEVSIHKFAKVFLDLGYAVDVVGLNEFNLPESTQIIDGINYTRFGAKSRKSFFCVLFYLFYILRIAKNYDLVVLNQFVPQLIAPFVFSKKLFLFHDLYGSLRTWRNAYPLIGILGYLIELMTLFNAKHFSDYVVAVSKATKAKLCTDVYFKNSKLVHVIPNYIEEVSESKKSKEDYLLFVGRFVSYKRPCDILEVLAKLRTEGIILNAKFVVARYEKKVLDEFKSLLNKYDLNSKVELILKPLTDSDLKLLIARAKMVVSPSSFEGQGLVVYEALSLKTKVVAYRLPCYSPLEAQLGLENLYLVESVGDLDSLKLAVVDCTKKDFNNFLIQQLNYLPTFDFVKQKLNSIVEA
jgi:glycosyltransferase involved in cell wall biosynthesis